jgi:probable HAF family extracellular repeat protein
MNKKLLHSLAILALTFFVGKCELLTAQSGNVNRSATELPGLHHELALANSRAGSSAIPESDRDAAPEGMAKTKVYKFRSIDYPGEYLSQVYDFNGKTAVGCTDFHSKAFTFHGNSYLLLNIPGTVYSCGYGINTPGDIVGDSEDSSGLHGFLYDGSRYTTFDYPGSYATWAWDINDAGLIVGLYMDTNDVYHGFLYDNGTFTAINVPSADNTFAYGINFSGDIVGTYNVAGIQHGFLLKRGTYSTVDVPEADDTEVYGINDAGSITGSYYTSSGKWYGFTYSGGVFQEVIVPEAPQTFLYRIKNNGNVVGYVIDSVNEDHGIIGR